MQPLDGVDALHPTRPDHQRLVHAERKRRGAERRKPLTRARSGGGGAIVRVFAKNVTEDLLHLLLHLSQVAETLAGGTNLAAAVARASASRPLENYSGSSAQALDLERTLEVKRRRMLHYA